GARGVLHRGRARSGRSRAGRGPGALGGAAWHLPSGRAAARAAGAGGCEPHVEPGGAPGVATAHPRAWPRAQQFARPYQVIGAEPRGAGTARSAATRLAYGPREWARRHRQSGRVAQPPDGGVRPARTPAATATGTGVGGGVGAPRPRARDPTRDQRVPRSTDDGPSRWGSARP